MVPRDTHVTQHAPRCAMPMPAMGHTNEQRIRRSARSPPCNMSLHVSDKLCSLDASHTPTHRITHCEVHISACTAVCMPEPAGCALFSCAGACVCVACAMHMHVQDHCTLVCMFADVARASPICHASWSWSYVMRMCYDRHGLEEHAMLSIIEKVCAHSSLAGRRS